MTKSTDTHHFRVLREAGVIEQRLDGNRKPNTLVCSTPCSPAKGGGARRVSGTTRPQKWATGSPLAGSRNRRLNPTGPTAWNANMFARVPAFESNE